jgi:hypothetical protein
VAEDAYNPACVVDDGSDGTYLRDAGPIFVITGVFGRSANSVDPSEPDAEYMATWMDTRVRSNGFMRFTVTKDSIDGQFVNSRGPFTDLLTITATPGSPTPTPFVTPAPCPPPSADMGAATLTVNFPATGSYYVWSRLMSADATHKAYWLQIDDACAVRVVGGQAGVWKWVDYQDDDPDSPLFERISGGVHTVRLYGIDAGVKVDKLLFTTDPDPVVPGMWPAGGETPMFLPLVIS